MRTSFQRVFLAILLEALFCVATASASPTLDAQIGLADHVVARRFAPILITLNGLPHPVEGSLVVEQLVGNAWRGEASAATIVNDGILVNRAYTSIIPLHDPGNPISVYLEGKDGDTIASTTLTLRGNQAPEPFSLLVGRTSWHQLLHASADPSSLPSHWAGYDALSSLWIASPPTRTETWEAIAGWILSGGSLVTGTGSDLYLLDSPLFREILPIQNPRITMKEDGTSYVTGQPRSSSRVLLERDGIPVAVSGPYGAGEVTWVSVRLSELTEDEALQIAGQITPSATVSLDAIAIGSFERLDVVRPSLPAALGLGVLVTALFSGIIAYGRRHPRVAAALVLTLSAFLSVSVALYISRTNPTIASYSSCTGFTVSTSFGITLASSAFATVGGTSIALPIDRGLLVQPDYTQDPHQPNYPSQVGLGEAWVGTAPGQRGSFRALGMATPRFDLSLDSSDPEEVRLLNRSNEACAGALLYGETAYRLSSIPEGVSIHRLEQGEATESFRLADPTLTELYQQFIEDFDLGGSPWLLVFCTESETDLHQESALRSQRSHLFAQKGGFHD